MYAYRHNGFVALGVSRLLPSWLRFLVKDKVERYVLSNPLSYKCQFSSTDSFILYICCTISSDYTSMLQ